MTIPIIEYFDVKKVCGNYSSTVLLTYFYCLAFYDLYHNVKGCVLGNGINKDAFGYIEWSDQIKREFFLKIKELEFISWLLAIKNKFF